MMMRKIAVTVFVAVFAACGGGDGGDALVAVCDDFHALVDDGRNLPEDWDLFEPVVDRADDVGDLEGAAANIRRDVEEGADVGDLQIAVEGFYNRCQEGGWDGLDG